MNPDIRAALERITKSVEHLQSCEYWGEHRPHDDCTCKHAARVLDALAEAVERAIDAQHEPAILMREDAGGWYVANGDESNRAGPFDLTQAIAVRVLRVRDSRKAAAIRALAPRSEP